MKRRQFIRNATAWAFTGLIFVPRLRAQSPGIPGASVPFFKAASAAGSACTTEAHSEGDTGSFDGALDWSAETWKANSFVAPSSFTVCKGQAYLAKQGTPAAGTLQALIYTDVGGVNPGTLIGTGSATVDRTGISSSQSFVDFTGIAASVTSGTTYWFVLKASALDTDTSNRIYWQEDVTGETSEANASNDGTVWTGFQTNRAWVFKLFS